jgi:hypothetical protein
MKRSPILVYLATILFIVCHFSPFSGRSCHPANPRPNCSSINPPFWPQPFTWENYRAIFWERSFYLNIINSLVVAGATTFICVGCWGLWRLTVWPVSGLGGKPAVLGFILVVSLFPPVALVSPLFLLFEQTGLINTYLALILPYLTFALPLTVWLLTAFFARSLSNWRRRRAGWGRAPAHPLGGDPAPGRARDFHHRHSHLHLLLERVPLCPGLYHQRRQPHHPRGHRHVFRLSHRSLGPDPGCGDGGDPAGGGAGAGPAAPHYLRPHRRGCQRIRSHGRDRHHRAQQNL